MLWPNGVPCWEVTGYTISERKRGLATSSANTYAAELSHLVRYCYQKKLYFSKFSDDRLFEFAAHLSHSTRKSEPRRGGSHINRILSQTIRFLFWLQTVVPTNGLLVGYPGEGAKITVTAPRHNRRQERPAQFIHPCFVASSERTVVRAMPDLVLENLLEAADQEEHRFFTRSRDTAMISLLADSGVRREELTFVRVEDVMDALSNLGKLSFRSSKRKGNPTRQVPVPLETLQELKENYIETARAICMERNLRRGRSDEGWLFCTQTGTRIRPSTITHIFSRLRLSAGLTEKGAPHMLRHRWINLQVVAGVRQLSSLSPISAGMMLTLLSRLTARTGHARVTSLLHYLDQSFEQLIAELAHGKIQQLESAQRAVAKLRRRIAQSLPHEEVDELLDAILLGLKAHASVPRLSDSVHFELGVEPRTGNVGPFSK